MHTMPNFGDDAYVSCLSRRAQVQGYVPGREVAEEVAPSIPLTLTLIRFTGPHAHMVEVDGPPT